VTGGNGSTAIGLTFYWTWIENGPHIPPYDRFGLLIEIKAAKSGPVVSINNPCFHVLYFRHPATTFLASFAQPHELFLTNTHGDVPLSGVLAVCRTKYIPPGGLFPPGDLQAQGIDFWYRCDPSNSSHTLD
jgi:hypothetical protein